jgi:hypothetical protein
MRTSLARHQWIVLVAVLIAIVLLFVTRTSAAQQGGAADTGLQLAQTQTWPPPPSSAPAAPRTPATPATQGGEIRLPPVSAQAPPGSAGFADAFGRFNLTLPSGTEPLNATYNLALPAVGLQMNLSVAPRDEIFRTSLQNFPDMMRKSGALDVGQQQFDHRGRQATMVVVRLRDAQGATIESVNVFIPGPNLWLQVNGPEQDAKRVEATMQALLQSLQYR